MRVLTGDDRRLETADVASWNRRANWAFLRLVGAGGQPIERAPARPGVGERCYFLDVHEDGSRAIVEATVSGTTGGGDLVISESTAGVNAGAPVLNEYGQAIGTTLGPASVAGASTLDLVVLGPDAGGSVRGGRVRGFPSLPAEASKARTLEDLDRAGEFVPALAHTSHFVQGVLGTGVERQGPAQIPVAVDQRFRFSRRESSCVVFVTWTPARKEDSTVAFELFDEHNRRLGGTDPAKARLRPSQSFVQFWTIPLSRLVPGIYRVDVKLGADPVWRTYFRVTD